jgi:hypothetical protein
MKFRGETRPGTALRPASATPVGARGVLRGANAGGIHPQPFRVGINRQGIERHVPNPGVRPPSNPLLDTRLSLVHMGQRAPRRSGATEPHPRLDNAPIIAWVAHIASFAGERIVAPLPLILSSIRWIVHEYLLGEEMLEYFSLKVDRAKFCRRSLLVYLKLLVEPQVACKRLSQSSEWRLVWATASTRISVWSSRNTSAYENLGSRSRRTPRFTAIFASLGMTWDGIVSLVVLDRLLEGI